MSKLTNRRKKRRQVTITDEDTGWGRVKTKTVETKRGKKVKTVSYPNAGSGKKTIITKTKTNKPNYLKKKTIQRGDETDIKKGKQETTRIIKHPKTGKDVVYTVKTKGNPKRKYKGKRKGRRVTVGKMVKLKKD